MLKYNELSIEFIIHFIINITGLTIDKSYEGSLETFKFGLKKYNKSQIKLINEKGKYISLKEFEKDSNKIIIIQKKNL